MSSLGGDWAPDGRDPRIRVFAVEGCPSGESPGTPRKRLPSAEDARCSSRPPPEGAGSVSISESEEKGGFCQQCQKKVAELKKQALALADQNSLKGYGMGYSS
ncbi:kinesin-like protein KIF26A [Xiphias gladius]|uniref:kinesin-like protein KIF26A n=1 Tax=Xiphias gladius TaxID=8245 RepID=UPI001A9869E5|nr:kinesin-like protein KIF26A [Xiphias gladius]